VRRDVEQDKRQVRVKATIVREGAREEDAHFQDVASNAAPLALENARNEEDPMSIFGGLHPLSEIGRDDLTRTFWRRRPNGDPVVDVVHGGRVFVVLMG
jgi:hypothetical protein